MKQILDDDDNESGLLIVYVFFGMVITCLITGLLVFEAMIK